MSEDQVKEVVDHKIGEMDLKEYAGRNASTYSGGNKRKLRCVRGQAGFTVVSGPVGDPGTERPPLLDSSVSSVAMALIGRPLVVFLDGKPPFLPYLLHRVITLAPPTRSPDLRPGSLHLPGGPAEPSTGMDPVARRFMWQVISDITTKRGECCIILTTHR